MFIKLSVKNHQTDCLYVITMKIIFKPYQTSPKQSSPVNFQGKTSDIPTEHIVELIQSGKSVREIASQLGIAVDTYYKLLRERNIPYNKQKPSGKTAHVTKEKLSELLEQNLPVALICKTLKIKENAYYKLIENFGLKSQLQLKKEKNASISREQLLAKVNSGLSTKEICSYFNIEEWIYYGLLKKYDIQTPRKESIAHHDSISKERFIGLLESGKKFKEILEELQITADVYSSLIAKFGITTEQKAQKENIAAITKEQMQELVDSGIPVKEICEILHINDRTYTRLLNKFEIITKRNISKQKIASIDAVTLQRMVDEKLSPTELTENLGITKQMFYRLLKRLNINYDYLHHIGEINIPKEKLEELATYGKTVKEITEELGIAQETYHEKAKLAKVNTLYRKSIDDIASIPKEKIQTMIDSGMSTKEICNELNITYANYTALLRKYNLSTNHRRSSERISNISKQQIEDLKLAGKTVKEICQKLNISESSYRRIMKRADK